MFHSSWNTFISIHTQSIHGPSAWWLGVRTSVHSGRPEEEIQVFLVVWLVEMLSFFRGLIFSSYLSWKQILFPQNHLSLSVSKSHSDVPDTDPEEQNQYWIIFNPRKIFGWLVNVQITGENVSGHSEIMVRWDDQIQNVSIKVLFVNNIRTRKHTHANPNPRHINMTWPSGWVIPASEHSCEHTCWQTCGHVAPQVYVGN